MDYIVSESQDIILTEEPEEILEIPFKFFNKDWDFLQEYLDMIGNPPYKLIGDLNLSDSKIKSLGNLQHVGGYLDLIDSNIESLGNLQHVGDSLYLGRTPLSKKTTEEEIRSQVEVKGDIYL